VTAFTRGDLVVSATRSQVGGVRVYRWSPVQAVASLVFCHGYMTSPASYSRLLDHVASHGIDVHAPVGHRRSFATLRGRRTVLDEVDDIERVATAVGANVIGGHSRGGQVAWRVASRTGVDGVVAVDPVDGEGKPGRSAPVVAPPTPSCPVLVVGTVGGGRCAPAGRDHRVFAGGASSTSPPAFPSLPGRHAVVDMGHADLLDPVARRLGGLVCGGVRAGGAVRATLAGLLVTAVTGSSVGEGPLPVTWDSPTGGSR
jgi:pimeloyl-ACP methyl ester carboxylesterase